MWPKGQKARQNDAFTQLTHTSSSSSSSWEALPRTTWVCTQKNAPHDAANLNFEKMRFFSYHDCSDAHGYSTNHDWMSFDEN